MSPGHERRTRHASPSGGWAFRCQARCARRAQPGLARGLLLSALLTLSACNEPLLSDLDEAAAHEAVRVLSAAGVAAEKRARGSRHQVEVHRDDVPRAWSALQRAAALAPPSEAPAPRRWVLSPTEARLAGRAAQANDLAATLRALPGVVAARVSLDAASAAVVLRVEPGAPGAAEVEALVRAGAGLGPSAPVAVARHPIGGLGPDRASPPAPAAPSEPTAVDAGARPPGGRRWLGAAATALALGGLAMLLRRRRQRLRPARG